MIDLDDALRDYAARWTDDQPPPPDLDESLFRARSTRARGRWSVGLVAACVALVAVLALGVVVMTHGRSPNRSAPAAPAPRSVKVPTSEPPIARLRSIALRAARPLGVVRTIRAVHTTDFAAELAFGNFAPPRPGPQVWLIQVSGHFQCMQCRGPGPAVEGAYVTVITGGGISASTITNQRIDLARLGPVITLHP